PHIPHLHLLPTSVSLLVFFFNITPAHRHLPFFPTRRSSDLRPAPARMSRPAPHRSRQFFQSRTKHGTQTTPAPTGREPTCRGGRSEEHTSELQSLTNLVCRLLLEKKKKIQLAQYHINTCSCA